MGNLPARKYPCHTGGRKRRLGIDSHEITRCIVGTNKPQIQRAFNMNIVGKRGLACQQRVVFAPDRPAANRRTGAGMGSGLFGLVHTLLTVPHCLRSPSPQRTFCRCQRYTLHWHPPTIHGIN
jgi:hypothetical protein